MKSILLFVLSMLSVVRSEEKEPGLLIANQDGTDYCAWDFTPVRYQTCYVFILFWDLVGLEVLTCV
jgi:hypothetical protein